MEAKNCSLFGEENEFFIKAVEKIASFGHWAFLGS
jgi:hypothetical protein